MDITEPQVLTRIAKSQVENGRVWFSSVHGITQGLKKRRHEICAGIDGNSVNVYEIRNGKSLISCSIPPDALLACAPCAVRSNTDSNQKALRSIYYAVQTQNTTKLFFYREQGDNDSSKSISKSLVPVNLTSSIVQLDILPFQKSYAILFLHDNGVFEVHSEDLATQLCRGQLQSRSDQSSIVGLQWLSADRASRTVLKSRPDLAATSNTGSSYILGVVHHKQNGSEGPAIEITLWTLSNLESIAPSGIVLDSLLSSKFSISSPLLPRDREPVMFARQDSRMIVRTHAKAYVIDLTLPSFRSRQEISSLGGDQISSIYLTDSLTLSSTSTSLQLQNTHFRTVQAKLDLDNLSLKRKRDNLPGGTIFFVAYYPTLHRIIASRRERIIAIDLRATDGREFVESAKHTSLLINNIGRGVLTHDRPKTHDVRVSSRIGRATKQQDKLVHWQESVQQMDQYIQEEDFGSFEQAFLTQLPQKLKSSTESTDLWGPKIDYVLSKVLSSDATAVGDLEPVASNLQLAFPAVKILELLATKGLLTRERIAKASRAAPNSRLNIDLPAYGQISKVMRDADPSLQLLHVYITQAPYIAHQELCAALQLLLHKALQESSDPASFALGHDASKLQGETSHGSAVAIRETVSTAIHTCLCSTLERLAQFAPTEITRDLRRCFNQNDLIALIQFSRQQLFQNGYTRSAIVSALSTASPLVSSGDEAGMRSLKNEEVSLSAITTILSACIDAIGPVGTVGFGDNEDFVQKLIPELASEISKATEGVEEAAFLEGVLRETIRYMDSTTHGRSVRGATGDATSTSRVKPGTIMTLYSEPLSEMSIDNWPAVLPLSLHAEGKINKLKVRKGDGKVSRRSDREMGMLQDRLRGPYALERLTL